MLAAKRAQLSSQFVLEKYGIDFSSAGVLRAKKAVPIAKLVIGDNYAQGFASDIFDVLICMETLEHLEHPERTLKDCRYASLEGMS